MTRAFFDRELDTVATFWRVYRRDGVLLAFTSHDRDLIFEAIAHRAAPGMVPAAIRLTATISDDSAEVEGALSHDSISAEDLAAGLFDEAAIEIGAVDWQQLESHILYVGRVGPIEHDQLVFSAALRSAKHVLDRDLVPRTSPTCRSEFCGPGCGLSAARFTSSCRLSEVDLDGNSVRFAGLDPARYLDGALRFLAGPQIGLTFSIVGTSGEWLCLDRPLSSALEPGILGRLREGCDHTISTCASRFQNAVNFRGEPFLPGNDLLTRYGPA